MTTGPGLVYLNPLSESILYVNIKIQTQTICALEIITRDNFLISLDIAASWHVTDHLLATFECINVERMVSNAVKMASLSNLSLLSLDYLLENLNTIAANMINKVNGGLCGLGVHVIEIQIIQIALSGDLKDSLTKAVQKRIESEARFKYIQSKFDADKAEKVSLKMSVPERSFSLKSKKTNSPRLSESSGDGGLVPVKVPEKVKVRRPTTSSTAYDFPSTTTNVFQGIPSDLGLQKHHTQDINVAGIVKHDLDPIILKKVELFEGGLAE
ncbi:Stomatin-3 [Zancudomyces culisetae]|uniref:Stomatin-3 n=1 Tax=Zancudomyces culisetae TaxID=1213189 RepID=A0A1R1PIA3_ZANCU|nr:Stomatin-3 [Zancudomyces culisetae]|eukprot:OMH80687.1 Stomatin-3 [Zancudomyces culisetae]